MVEQGTASAAAAAYLYCPNSDFSPAAVVEVSVFCVVVYTAEIT